ncbi:MAG TPA: GNAT family N-acetyltransferase [Frankiaceae bacterium]|nr:GNAT family N-acetyltransferase [Frankiaceae bacterium]
MVIERYDDPVAYADLVSPTLLRDEARYNLELAVVSRVARGETFGTGTPLLLTVDGAPALMTPPHNVLMQALPAKSAPALAEYLHAEGIGFPGALGRPDAVTAFAECYAALSGAGYQVTREQGAYELRELVPPAPAPGALRTATLDDAGLVLRWCRAFTDEVGLPPLENERVRDRITLEGGGFWLWEDGAPVSLAGCGGYTPNGARIGPVYTPPELRGRGYASAVTAGVTKLMLDRGRTSTFLYTDLANPTSNKIYRAMGYRHVADVREVSFERR